MWIIPLSVGTVLEVDNSAPSIDASQYCHLVGKLIYLCHIRPAVSYAVSMVSRFMHSPQTSHWLALIHILKYFNFTKDYGILYQRVTPSELRGFTNANYPSCKNTPPSIGAYLFQLRSEQLPGQASNSPMCLIVTPKQNIRLFPRVPRMLSTYDVCFRSSTFYNLLKFQTAVLRAKFIKTSRLLLLPPRLTSIYPAIITV